MNLKEIQKEMNELEKEANQTFAEFVKELLEQAEEDFYCPFENKSLEELQMYNMDNASRWYEERTIYNIKRWKKLKEMEEKIFQYEVDDEDEDDLTLVIEAQIKDKIIKIEKHYRVKKDEYNVFDWLADADPENFLEFFNKEE